MLVGSMFLIDTSDEDNEMSEDERRDKMSDDAMDGWDAVNEEPYEDRAFPGGEWNHFSDHGWAL